MKRKIISLLVLLSVPVSLGAQQPMREFYRSHPGYHATVETFWQETKSEGRGGSRVAKALLMSAIIPGLGQAYNQDYWKVPIFLAVEGVTWFVVIDQTRKGDRLEEEFEAFADLHWSEDRYWQALAAESGFDVNDLDALRAYERASFSHHLPAEKNQTYYENIGKYNQFNIGWDDATEHRARDSERREVYTFMRKDSNDAFARARTASAIVLLNHIGSALEAGFTARSRQRQVTGAMRIEPMQYDRDIIPALALRLTW